MHKLRVEGAPARGCDERSSRPAARPDKNKNEGSRAREHCKA